MKKINTMVGLSLVAGMLFAPPSIIAEPAVSGINAKIEAVGGNTDGTGSQALQGSFTMPLGSYFGGQVDLLGGKIGGDTISGAGGHVFWRNPEFGLVGITASQSRLDKIDFSRYGAEAEYYLNNFTINIYGGRQEGDTPNTGYAGATASYYITENILVQLGGETVSDQHNGNVNVEWQPEFTPNGLSLFVNGMSGNNDIEAIYAGVKFYIGANKSLIDRHRKDDPSNQLYNNFVNTISLIQAEQNANVEENGATECPAGWVDDGLGGCVFID